MPKLVIICILFSVSGILSHAQSIIIEKPRQDNDNSDKTSVIKLKKEDNAPLAKYNDADYYNSFENSVRSNTQSILHPVKIQEKPKFDIISSYRNNIHFAGFWNGYAILNFTPTVFIQPFDFISIYANHNFSNYIPVKDIKENFKSLFIEGAAVLAIDNSVKFLLSGSPVIRAVTEFVLKNLAISIAKKSFSSSSNTLLEFKYYYYAVSIRF